MEPRVFNPLVDSLIWIGRGVKCFLGLTRAGVVCYSSVCNRLEPVTGVPRMIERLLGT